MNKISNIEDLSADMLNDDFIQIFQPIFFLLRILGLLQVNIKYRYPTAPSKWYYLYSNAFWILNTVCVLHFLLRCQNVFDSQYADSTLKFGVLMIGINVVLIVLRNTFQRGNKVGQMYIKLQKIERYLNMKNARSLNKQLSKLSAAVIVTACIVSNLWMILFNIVFIKKTCVALLIAIATGVGLQVEMAQVYFIMHLITIRVNYINDLLKRERSLIANKELNQSIDGGKLFYIMNSTETQDEQGTDEVVSSMHCILETLADFTELFQFPIFCFVCQILIWNLVSIQNLVTSIKVQRALDIDLLSCVTPLLLFMQLIILSICIKTESLSKKLEKSRKLCIDIVSSSFDDGKSRDHAKQVILLVEGRQNVSIYNIYTLGTRLPLHLLAVTASYTIVLLQFALL